VRDPREFATAAYPLRAPSLPALVLQGLLDQVREAPDGLGLFGRKTGRTDGTQMPNGSAHLVAACSVAAGEPVAPALIRGAGPFGGKVGAWTAATPRSNRRVRRGERAAGRGQVRPGARRLTPARQGLLAGLPRREKRQKNN
jgi:hypothetical protein